MKLRIIANYLLGKYCKLIDGKLSKLFHEKIFTIKIFTSVHRIWTEVRSMRLVYPGAIPTMLSTKWEMKRDKFINRKRR